MTAAQLDRGLPRPLSPKPHEARIDLTRLLTMHRGVPSTTFKGWDVGDALNTPTRTGCTCAHSAWYKKDDHASNRQALGQSITLCSTLLIDKTTLGLGYITMPGSTPPKSRLA